MNELIRLIKMFEGLRLRSYRCPAGVWTIGYGSTGKGIGPGLVWTLEQATHRMESDAGYYFFAAHKLCPGISGNRLQAVADFAYNLGSTRLAGSSLRRYINSGRFSEAAAEFDKWVYAGGKKLPGLVIRRAAERELFKKV